MLFFVSTRLRLPLFFFMAPFAGYAIVASFGAWKSGRRLPAAILAVGLLLTVPHWLLVLEEEPLEAVRLAAVLSRQGRLDESLAVLENAAAEPEPDPHALDQSGWVLSKRGEPEKARDRYLRALERGLSGAMATRTRSRLAGVYERLGEMELASAMHDAAVGGDDATAGAFFERALFLLRRGEREAAKADLLRATAMAPDWPEPQAVLRSLEVNPER
jgi:tetratricopeptide (TPR) repeat protein